MVEKSLEEKKQDRLQESVNLLGFVYFKQFESRNRARLIKHE